MVELLRSPWDTRFDRLLTEARSSLVLCSPFIGRGPCERISRNVAPNASRGFEVSVLTDLSRDNILSGSTDVAALSDLVKAIPSTTVRFLPSLHAKVYIADERQAIVTSGNMTDSGLVRNFEYGVFFSEPETVRAIRQDVLEYTSLGSPIDGSQLANFAAVVGELREMRQAADRQIRSRLRREFDRRLRKVDDEILSARAAGRTAHAIFADAIRTCLPFFPVMS